MESEEGSSPDRGRRATLLSHGFTKFTVYKVHEPDVPSVGTKRARKRKMKDHNSEMSKPNVRGGSEILRKFISVKRRLIPAEKLLLCLSYRKF